jgi:hypothetical protein
VTALLALATCAILAGPAQAADNTRYISIAGKNTNPCTLVQPCRTLQRGINIAPAGGELRVLDSGDYGANGNIRKSLTITGNGNTIFVANGIAINKADAVVALRGLTLDGQGTTTLGVLIENAAAVHVERCVVHSFASHAIQVAADGVKVFVLDSISRDNGGHGFLIAGAGASHVTIDNSRFENNLGTGVLVSSGHATIHRSTVSGNVSQGIFVDGASVSVTSTMAVQNPTGFFVKSGSVLTVESSLAHDNSIGLFVTGSTARISNSTFTENTTGISNGGGVETRGNNTVRGNTTDLSGNALTPIGGV